MICLLYATTTYCFLNSSSFLSRGVGLKLIVCLFSLNHEIDGGISSGFPPQNFSRYWRSPLNNTSFISGLSNTLCLFTRGFSNIFDGGISKDGSKTT